MFVTDYLFHTDNTPELQTCLIRPEADLDYKTRFQNHVVVNQHKRQNLDPIKQVRNPKPIFIKR